ncbi:MAG: F0F1 ATP synthase subunit A [Chloroflexi bacterium]|nr:F0F1 ATP synthase subunit A [Chloroflexota bacterium]
MGLLRRPKVLLAIGLVLGSLIISHTILRFPFPPIQIKPEALRKELISFGGFGDFNLTNTMLSSWLGLTVILALTYFATRKLGLVPRGLQNLVEAVLEWLYSIVVSVAGPGNARRFYPLVATIFIFVIINNWISLLPGYGTVGKMELADEVIEEVIEEKAADADPEVTLHLAEQKFEEFFNWSEDERAAAPSDHLGKLIFEELENTDLHIYDKVGPFRVMPFRTSKQKMSALEYSEEYVTFDDGEIHFEQPEDKRIGLLIPYLRNANTGLNTTLALALVAMFFVEFWGVRTLGIFGYGSKFFNFSGFRNGLTTGLIDLFVGMLEAISEIARLISFTFRLFGNMFAGEILIFVMMFLIPLGLAVPFYGLELFVGFIQATIFAVLALMFATIAVTAHDHEKHKEDVGQPAANPELDQREEVADTTP